MPDWTSHSTARWATASEFDVARAHDGSAESSLFGPRVPERRRDLLGRDGCRRAHEPNSWLTFAYDSPSSFAIAWYVSPLARSATDSPSLHHRRHAAPAHRLPLLPSPPAPLLLSHGLLPHPGGHATGDLELLTESRGLRLPRRPSNRVGLKSVPSIVPPSSRERPGDVKNDGKCLEHRIRRSRTDSAITAGSEIGPENTLKVETRVRTPLGLRHARPGGDCSFN